MKSKHAFRALVLLLCLLGTASIAQKQKTLCRLVILDARLEGQDVTEYYVDRKQFLTLYETSNGEIYFANVAGTTDEQSYGRTYNTEWENGKETQDAFPYIKCHFKWSYINSYDKKRGTGTVQLFIIKKPQGNMFICTMVLENLEQIVYKGYVEGTLDLSGLR
jgi:hypothetical protein